MATTKPNKSFLLDNLPIELRLSIYSHLLIANTPLKGQLARHTAKYNLHTAILRVNHQIHNEALPVFLSKNVFSITSIPPSTANDPEEGSGAFEPPLQLAHLPLVRHLEVDLLYYPHTLRTTSDPLYGGWLPRCVGSERYVTSLSYVLNTVQSTLQTLEICADTRRYESCFASYAEYKVDALSDFPAHDDEIANDYAEEDKALDVKKFLTGFHMADKSLRFQSALANLSITQIPLRFDFPESCFDFVANKTALMERGLVILAGQVLFARSEIRMKALIQELGIMEDICVERMTSSVETLDSRGHIALTWSCRDLKRAEVREKR